MGTLEIVFLVLWGIFAFIELGIRRTLIDFISGTFADGIILGIVYVILHMFIKHW
jgi:intergrase/recombinase